MADPETKTCGGLEDLAKASVKCRVPITRLSRMPAFLSGVQRPTMLSPARWITASKPETVSGESGCEGSQLICSPPVALPRTRRTTEAPDRFNAGTSADPMGPETPVTSTRETFMAVTLAEREDFEGTCRDKQAGPFA